MRKRVEKEKKRQQERRQSFGEASANAGEELPKRNVVTMDAIPVSLKNNQQESFIGLGEVQKLESEIEKERMLKRVNDVSFYG